MRQTLVIANWKMNGSREANRQWVKAFLARQDDLPCQTVVCAPFVYLNELAGMLEGSSVRVGSQSVSQYDAGAYTGEVSADMLADIGATWGIVGHSERRRLFGETDAVVAQKAARLVAAGIKPILCVGETLQQRDNGQTREVVLGQLQAVIDAIGADALGAVAYEPVWAIGTGKTATPEMAQEVHAALRERIAQADPDVAQRIALLYGGSVKPGNAHDLFKQPDIDGGLIGGAALKAEDFYLVCSAAR